VGTRCADHVTPLYPQKLALTSPTSGGRSVGIVRVRTKATESELYHIYIASLIKYCIQPDDGHSYIQLIIQLCYDCCILIELLPSVLTNTTGMTLLEVRTLPFSKRPLQIRDTFVPWVSAVRYLDLVLLSKRPHTQHLHTVANKTTALEIQHSHSPTS